MHPWQYNSPVAMVNQTQAVDTHGPTMETKLSQAVRIAEIAYGQDTQEHKQQVEPHHRTSAPDQPEKSGTTRQQLCLRTS